MQLSDLEPTLYPKTIPAAALNTVYSATLGGLAANQLFGDSEIFLGAKIGAIGYIGSAIALGIYDSATSPTYDDPRHPAQTWDALNIQRPLGKSLWDLLKDEFEAAQRGKLINLKKPSNVHYGDPPVRDTRNRLPRDAY